MKFRMQVGLGRGHIALDGDPAPPPRLIYIAVSYQLAIYVYLLESGSQRPIRLN